MARTLITTVPAIVLLIIALGQAAGQQADQHHKIEQEVMQLERKRNEALAQRDLTVIDGTMAEQYIFITPSGQVINKAQEMASFRAGATQFESFTTEDVNVRGYENTAVVTGRAMVKGQSAGQDISGEYHYMRVYAKPHGELQIVTSHFTRIVPSSVSSDAEATTDMDAEIITVRPSDLEGTRQGLQQFVGISESTAGAKGLSMNLVVIPAGAQAKPHRHRGYESTIYILQGRVETRYGVGLNKSVINQEGDFLFIPADVPHQPKNLSDTEPAMAIVARNDPNEQESVVPYEPAQVD